MHETQPGRGDSWPVYHLLIVIALAIAAGRIAVVRSPEGDTAFLSANDRSRWSTVASLVERGTYAIDQQIAITHPIKRNRRPWDSIDKVRHLGPDGKQHYYSSKPPLLATMVAGVYQLVRWITGMTLSDQPIYVARIILALVNLPLLAGFLYATIASMDRLMRRGWGNVLAAAACCFGTMVLPFAITLNNHLPACAATALVMWIYIRYAIRQPSDADDASSVIPENVTPVTETHETKPIPFAMAGLAGLAAGLAVANELPALSMAALWWVLFAWRDRTAVFPFTLGIALVALAFFGTNWMAHQSLRPPYMHRGNGAPIGSLASQAASPDQGLQQQVLEKLQDANVFAQPGAAPDQTLSIVPSDETDRWIVQTGQRQYALLKGGEGWELRDWDDWYEYPGTYWKDGERRGVDQGEPSKLVYLLHLTIGHHGLFSLTPIWLLIPVGWIVGIRRGPPAMQRYHGAVLVASVVCFLFYLNRPLIDRNYGGVSVCFRWLLWFTPLWLVTVAPIIDRLAAARWQRALLLALLALSIFSVSTSLQTPWQSPWLYQFWRFLGWISG